MYEPLRSVIHFGEYVWSSVPVALVGVAPLNNDSGKLFPGQDAALQDTLTALAALLETSLAEVRAALPGQHPASGSAAQAARPGADLDRAARAGKVLADALRRGALDDAALAGLAAAVTGHPLAVRVTQVHAALSDFDFDLALQQLDGVLEAIDDLAQEAIE